MGLSREIKTGMFFLFALFVLVFLTFKVEDMGDWFRGDYRLRTLMKHAAGLSIGDRVAIAGVPAGEVQDIRLHDEDVEVVLLLHDDKRVKADAVATIGWSNLLGGRYVDITMGTPGAKALEPEETIESKESIEIGRLMEKFDLAANELRELLRDKPDGLGSKISKLVTNLTEISEKIKSGEGTLGKIISDPELYTKANQIAEDLRSAAGELKKVISRNEEGINKIVAGLADAAPGMRKAVDSVQKLAKKLEAGEGTLPKLINDPALYEDLKEAVASIKNFAKQIEEGEGTLARLASDKEMAEELSQAIRSLKVLAERLEKGDSTLAKLARDKDLYEDVKKLIGDAREAVKGVKEQIPVGTFAGILMSAF